ncbi:TolC family protein [uncultured Gimesia sp.]|uniref:TolC family protein n=1 Tax=uncultured Gimesia sp. TaxID=1678688 RepID=UPI00262FCCE5|nr:TolC family protein [uncultured Gimesia sp.]
MSLMSIMTSFTLLLCAGVAGCQGYQYTAFTPVEKSKAADFAQRDGIKQKRSQKYISEKKPLFVELGFDDDESSHVNKRTVRKFPAQNRQERIRKRKIVEHRPIEAVPNKPEVVIEIPKASENRLVGHTNVEPTRLVNLAETSIPPAPGISVENETGSDPSFSIDDTIPFGLKSYPIDLPATLRLAGAQNWNVLLAMEQINEAYARQAKAKAMWIPSLNAGIGYTKHEGQIQGTNGVIQDISRNSLFVGGGAISANNPPLTGGAGGPARLGLDLSLTDTIFEPLAECQLYNASRSNYTAAFNDTLLEASLGYYDLVKAQGDLAIAKKNLENAQELLTLTQAFVNAGKGSRADVSRSAVEVTKRKQAIINAELSMKIASTNLIRVLQLDPEEIGTQTLLIALEEQPLPVSLVQESTPLDQLISQGQTYRPELDEQTARMEANRIRARAEHWRPFLPNLHMGASGGGFGGGVNDNLNGLDGRADVDVLAVWSIENLGFGTRARRQQSNSVYQQSVISTNRAFDLVLADVTNAWNTVQAQRSQIQLAEENIKRASESYDQNMGRIRGLAGLPLEGLQSFDALANARQTYLNSIIAYNQAQLNLLRAIGRPPGIQDDEEQVAGH